MKNIVIVGAGYAGVLTAKKLAKKLGKKKDVSITIIDKNPFHTMLTELHEVAAGRVEEQSIQISLQRVFAGRNVNVVQDRVVGVDFDHKKVNGEDRDYPYDTLVLAAGSKTTYWNVPGAEEYSFPLWSFEDAVSLRDHIHNQFRKAAVERDPDTIKKLLSFAVVGAGFTGVEMIGELAEYVPILCQKHEIDPAMVTMYNMDLCDRAVPILPEKLSAKVERRLEKMGVKLMLGSSVCEIGADYIETSKDGMTVRHTAGTVIWTAGIESADIALKACETLPNKGRGRIEVDAYLRSVDRSEVFVVGDNMFYIPPGEKQPVPQMVENCEHSAATAAHNITVSIVGSGTMKQYTPSFHGVMVCVGGRYGVARVGTPKFMMNLPSFLAMFCKHFINIVYFVQVLGWNKVFSYMKHEFFTIRNKRSFVGGHFSNRTPSFLLVPLRVWLGAVWVFEGVMKVIEGWFQQPMLTGFFGGANAWYDSILQAAGALTTGAADAVTAATGAADAAAEAVSAGTAIFSVNIIGLFDMIFVSGKELIHSGIADYAFKLNVPLMNWFVERFVLSSDSMQLFMQISIVVAEILLGLALMGGLFTTPASAVSLVLQFMFVCTTGLYLNTFWMAFAAIALLFGSGYTIGLDYYAMPWLKKMWKKIPFIKKWYVYND